MKIKGNQKFLQNPKWPEDVNDSKNTECSTIISLPTDFFYYWNYSHPHKNYKEIIRYLMFIV